MQFTKDDIERYKPQINLKKINIQGQKKIQQSNVLVIGLGGIGSPLLEFLARAGIKKIGLCDFDKVSKSNLHRQFYNTTDINKNKSKSAAKKVKLIDKKIKLKIINKKISKLNIKQIAQDYDYIIEGTDSFVSKLLVNDFCKKNKKKLFIGSVSQFDSHIFFFDFNKNGSCLRCFMPKSPNNTPRCQDEGILGTVTGITATLIANEVLKEIAGVKSTLQNHVLISNFENLTFRKVKINISKKCGNHD